jgi:hypothetical protein
LKGEFVTNECSGLKIHVIHVASSIQFGTGKIFSTKNAGHGVPSASKSKGELAISFAPATFMQSKMKQREKKAKRHMNTRG